MPIAALITFAFNQVGLTELKQDWPVVEAVTYRTQENMVYVPLRSTLEHLEAVVEYDSVTMSITADRQSIPKEWITEKWDESFVNLYDLDHLYESLGVRVIPGEIEREFFVTRGANMVRVVIPPHKVEVSLNRQQLIAWQGSRLILFSNCSTGRSGFWTPRGEYTAGPEFSRYRVSRKYENSPMPYSVQVIGGVFIHGSSSVPRRPASHGCIRMPLTGSNPARRIFEWIEPGASIVIATDFSESAKAFIPSS